MLRILVLGLYLFVTSASAQVAREILTELIAINTTDSGGNNTTAAEAMAKRLLAAGYPQADVQVLVPPGRPTKGNLVARLRAKDSQLRPFLFFSHLDVVEARREDWTTNPFELVEKDGYLYGRGTQDVKGLDAVLMATFIRLKQEGYVPPRDMILALTSDEEGGTANGADWLLKNHRTLLDAEIALNADMGGVSTEKGKATSIEVTAAEKLYADFQFMVTNPGGHSSRPTPENAIYRLAHGLEKLENAPFPFELNPVTRAFFESVAGSETAARKAQIEAVLKPAPAQAALAAFSADPRFNGLTHTTCVATRLDAGHANNALPQRAIAVVNCRILPGHSAAEVQAELIRKAGDPQVSISYIDGKTASVVEKAPEEKAITPVTPRKDVMNAIRRTGDSFWPGAPVVVDMATGASDSKYTAAAGIPSYGIGMIAIDHDDVRAHGRDERIRAASFNEAVEFNYRFVKALLAGQ
ncbi:MAG: Acetylornithine deacetylase [Bryobacterales bacterium]|nr:Acetylornithine deacetylase [Bryobacterales bacterium]